MNLLKNTSQNCQKNIPSIINGDFNCSFKNLSNLDGFPEEINGDFNCEDNYLTSLVGCPQKISGSIDCSNNLLQSLNGLPPIIKKGFYARQNLITTLVGGPKIVYGDFGLLCNKLTDLEGSPREITGFFSLDGNNLTSLFGITPKIGDSFYCTRNKNLTDISDVWNSTIGDKIYIGYHKKLAILPLVRFDFHIDNDYENLYNIMYKHRGSSKQNIIDLQYDLIENGFEENARWKPGIM